MQYSAADFTGSLYSAPPNAFFPHQPRFWKPRDSSSTYSDPKLSQRVPQAPGQSPDGRGDWLASLSTYGGDVVVSTRQNQDGGQEVTVPAQSASCFCDYQKNANPRLLKNSRLPTLCVVHLDFLYTVKSVVIFINRSLFSIFFHYTVRLKRLSKHSSELKQCLFKFYRELWQFFVFNNNK